MGIRVLRAAVLHVGATFDVMLRNVCERGMLTQRDARVIESLPDIKVPSLVVVVNVDLPSAMNSLEMCMYLRGLEGSQHARIVACHTSSPRHSQSLQIDGSLAASGGRLCSRQLDRDGWPRGEPVRERGHHDGLQTLRIIGDDRGRRADLKLVGG